MQWERRDRYFEEDATGRYRVSAARIGKRWRFSAWRRDGETWVLLAVCDSAAEARSVCDGHKSERAAA